MILYFSGTGNTLWATKQLATSTNEQTVNISQLSEGEISIKLKEGERLGFCFPVHAWRVPRNVRNVLERLCIDTQGHYVYALCTAGDNIGETFDELRQILSKRNVTVDATCSLIMPESYVGLPFMDVDKPENEQRKIEEAQNTLNHFITTVKECRREDYHIIRGHWPRINSRLLGSCFERWLITDKPFHVNETRCVKCGICADVCPTHDIIGGLGQVPQWRHNDSCLTCFACYHHCPHHAIEYGKRTQGKGQYFFGRRKL
ncbi:MAG: EFR1 family ferrodoxin [Prevotella sp.]|jgi:NAD-dependent dihydropyrimidine dehydrogenase PreA subunit